MDNAAKSVPSFNLWTEPWIMVERADGALEWRGIADVLLDAHAHRAIYHPSPLVVVGIHRLLVAVLQVALDPHKPRDLRRILDGGRFPREPIERFGAQYAGRFDLFSENEPFLQSADLPLQPGKKDKTKSAAIFVTEIASGSEVTHFRHGNESGYALCPVCIACGLTTIPCFAASGGRSFQPSINGVPPIYVLPGGRTLFESLAASMILPPNQPQVASKSKDRSWWTREPVVERGLELDEVGYLHSLTFPARRVRVHPERVNSTCTWCGTFTLWGGRTMVFEMGECRPKGAPAWFDPFVAYRIPAGDSERGPTPIRPTQGRALWREYAALFLKGPAADGKDSPNTKRPSVLDQLDALDPTGSYAMYPLRCIGIRYRGDAKVFEWLDAGFDVPAALLRDDTAWLFVDESVDFAEKCDAVIQSTFKEAFRSESKQEHYINLRRRMGNAFWTALAEPFRELILVLSHASPDEKEHQRLGWAEAVVNAAQRVFEQTAQTVGDDAASLRGRVQGERRCRARLYQQEEKFLTGGRES